jgi:hypothetical protein
MLLDFDHLVSKYEMKIKGVLHIGAHYGQEHGLYKRHGIENISYFEPLQNNFEKLQENVVDGSTLHKVALGNESCKYLAKPYVLVTPFSVTFIFWSRFTWLLCASSEIQITLLLSVSSSVSSLSVCGFGFTRYVALHPSRAGPGGPVVPVVRHT